MTIDIDLKDSKLDQKFVPVKSKKISSREKRNSFATPEEKKKRKKKKIMIIVFTVLLLVLGMGFLIYKGYIFSHDFGFRFGPGSLILREEQELKKDSSGNFTNVLLVGLDTRENGGLLNTDTIIMASYNYKTDNISLISVPRDFHVEIEEDLNWYVRINSIYSNAEQKKKNSGIEELRKTVERLSGQEIQYYAVVDFKAFTEIIDAVGGLDINVENSFTDYRYPLGKDYQTVSFQAGPQSMDGEKALIFSRSRHSMQNSEGSDFARAKRQQKVIQALKDKLLSSESLTNPKKLIGIFSSIAGNVQISEFTIKDVEAALELAKTYEEKGGKTYSFVLDPSVGNYSLVEKKVLESGAYAIGPKLGLGAYKDIQNYISTVLNAPEIYSEDPTIMVYDTGAGNQKARKTTTILQEEFPYLNILFGGTLHSDKQEVVIYSNKEKENQYSIERFSKFLESEQKDKPEYITTNLNGEDVTILLGSNLGIKEN